MYKVLIVDDEFLARKLLTGYVARCPELELVGACSNAMDAHAKVTAEQVDILLLDIHMPDVNGLQLARMCTSVPAIVFTTAYSEYALESYDIAAVDYLLKPIAFDRFRTAIEKAITKLKAIEATDREAERPAEEKDYIIVKADYKLYKVNFSDLLYIEGQHEYVSFYTTERRITALFSLKSLEETLPSDRFVRIHRSYIVNIAYIKEIRQGMVSICDQLLPIGGSYRESVIQRLGIG